jgi:hypothetical protein
VRAPALHRRPLALVCAARRHGEWDAAGGREEDAVEERHAWRRLERRRRQARTRRAAPLPRRSHGSMTGGSGQRSGSTPAPTAAAASRGLLFVWRLTRGAHSTATAAERSPKPPTEQKRYRSRREPRRRAWRRRWRRFGAAFPAPPVSAVASSNPTPPGEAGAQRPWRRRRGRRSRFRRWGTVPASTSPSFTRSVVLPTPVLSAALLGLQFSQSYALELI